MRVSQDILEEIKQRALSNEERNGHTSHRKTREERAKFCYLVYREQGADKEQAIEVVTYVYPEVPVSSYDYN